MKHNSVRGTEEREKCTQNFCQKNSSYENIWKILTQMGERYQHES